MVQPFDLSQKTLNRSPLDDPRLLSGPFWGELRIFLAVAKAKSFNKAAEELHMSQPTVSRQVRRLQDLIGSQLVVSLQNTIKLTPQGKELAEALIALDEKLFEISQELKAENKEAEGLVRVSVTEALAGLFIAPKLSCFSARHPKIQLHIRNPSNLTAFRDNLTDIMIGYTPGGSGVTSTPLGYIHLIPQASRGYIERYGMPTRANLESHLFIDTEYYTARTEVWQSWHKAIARGDIAHYCDNSFAYGLLVKSGIGIGLLGSYALSDPALLPLELGVHVTLPIHVLALADRLQAKPVRLVYDWLQEIFSPDIPWFAPQLTLRDLPVDLLAATTERLLAGPHTSRHPTE